MKKAIAILLTIAVSASLLIGCGPSSQPSSQNIIAAQTGAKTNLAADTQSGNSVKETPESSPEVADKIEGNTSYTIGIGQFAEHGSLGNCREGFLVGLVESDIQEGRSLTILYENSQVDDGTASQTATNFTSKEVDLMCSTATPMVQAECGVAKELSTPIIFTAVANPVAAELANVDGTPMGEITGASNKLPMKQRLKMTRAILPDAKKAGVMYTTNEVNSESIIAKYKEFAPDYGFEIVDTGVLSSVDILLAAGTLTNKADCITNLTDNIVVAFLPVILDKTVAKNISVFGSGIEQAKTGCLVAIGLDYIEPGEQTRKMTAQILRDEKKASELDYEIIKEAVLYGNTKVAEDLDIALPEDLTIGAAELFSRITQQT